MGPKTRAALAAADGPKLYSELCAARMEFTGRAITKNLKDDDHDGIPDHTKFASGRFAVRGAYQLRSVGLLDSGPC